jgi:hypothetical protein
MFRLCDIHMMPKYLNIKKVPDSKSTVDKHSLMMLILSRRIYFALIKYVGCSVRRVKVNYAKKLINDLNFKM